MNSLLLDVSSVRDRQREVLAGLRGDIQLIDRPELAGSIRWSGAASEPVHRWFRYREAFAPGLIEQLGLKPPFLDPFSGSGSIIVGAAERGFVGTGIDLNPLATFVSRVKLRPLDPEQLRQLEETAADEARLRAAAPWPMPRLGIADRLFEPEIADELQRLRTVIAEVDDEAVRDALLMCWLSVLEPCGSFFKEGNGIKYRRRKRTTKGYVLRPEGDWQRERFGTDQRSFVRQTFREAVGRVIEDAHLWLCGSWGEQTIIDGSAMECLKLTGPEQFNTVVFSPPYANRFDYFESMKVELWFGEFVKEYQDATQLRKRSVRSHLGADLGAPARTIDELEELLELMDPEASSVRMGMPTALRGYFHDIATVLEQSRVVLRPGGSCNVVVGNSAFAGVIVPTDLLIARLGLKAGFEQVRIERARHLTVAPQQRTVLAPFRDLMRESVVIFS
jgi:hypothetical protein